MLTLIKELSSGFLIGIANIIPGVSGGTFLLILGMYQRVMSAISGLNAAVVRELLHHLSGILFTHNRKTHLTSFTGLFIKKDLFFLMKLVTGVGIAIVVLSDLMLYLLTKQFSNTYALFFGLILISTLISLKLVRKLTVGRVLMLLLGAAVTVAVTMAVNPADKAKTKSDHYKSRYEQTVRSGETKNSAPAERALFRYTGEYSVAEFAVGAFAGALSVSAMILPGVSGSLVLILIGQYYKVINAVSSLRTLQLDHLIFLSIFALGMIIGVLLFARLVTFVFKRFYFGTIAFLTGLMAGSLYTLWPFKSFIVIDQYVKGEHGITVMHDTVIRTNINILPTGAAELVTAVIICAVGAGIMLLLGRYNEK